MSHQCTCSDPGYCEKFNREMDARDYSICQNCVNSPPRAAIVGGWYRDKLKADGKTAGCAWKGSPILNEFGNHKFRKTCGCGGQPSKIYLFECFHPQERQAEDNCEGRCTDYLSL